MPMTSLDPFFRFRRGPAVWSAAILISAAQFAGGGCQGDVEAPGGGASGASGSGSQPTAGAGGSGGTSNPGSGGAGSLTTGGGTNTTSGGSGSGGTNTTTGGASGNGNGGTNTTGGASGNGNGGTNMTTGGASGNGGMSGSGGATSGAGGSRDGGSEAGRACVDVQPPPDPNWPGATCQRWATETAECNAAWFATYCDVSCGRCVPQGGGAGGAADGGGSRPGDAGIRDASVIVEGAAGMGGSNSAPEAASPVVPNCTTMPNVTGSTGWASRYWDCCQTHCGLNDGHRCTQDGTTRSSNNTSACTGGSSFACYDESPRAVSDCLSYGYIAKANPNCGGCYRIQFTGQGQHNANDPGSQAIRGKQMIVKVSNTGGDVGSNQFDLMVPGGGVGLFNACSRQWGTSDLGAQYGGFMTSCTGDYAAKKTCVRQQCNKVPAGPARQGCLWYVDWLQAADNPKFTFQETSCPF